MTTFSKKSKKLFFGPFFGQKSFLKKFSSVTHSNGLLTPCWVPEKNKEPIPRKLSDERMEGQTDPNS